MWYHEVLDQLDDRDAEREVSASEQLGSVGKVQLAKLCSWIGAHREVCCYL